MIIQTVMIPTVIRTIVMVLVSLLVMGRLLHADNGSFIWRSQANTYIKYVDREGTHVGDNDHPVELDPQSIVHALSALKIRDSSFFSRQDDVKTLLSFQQIQLLGKHLSQGLSTARSDQDIVFVLPKVEAGILFMKKRSFTTGRVFYQDRRLNLIVGEYERYRNDAFEKVYDPSGQLGVPYTFHYGSRLNAGAQALGTVIKLEGVENKTIGGETRRDWFLIDVSLVATVQSQRQQGVAALKDEQVGQREAEDKLQERWAMRSEMARMRKELEALKATLSSAEAGTVEKRLATLQNLLDKQLISQEEYDARRAKMLSEI